MNLLTLLIGCGFCGQTTFQNTGAEFTVGGESTPLDTSGGEECGVRGSYADLWDESLSNWPGSKDVQLLIRPNVETILSWEIGVSFAWNEARGGNQVSFEEGTLGGSPCYRTINGCEYGLAMTSGTIDILDMNARHDPCDPFAKMEMDMSWDLEFGDPGSEEYWVTSSGSDIVGIDISYLCAE